MQLVYLGRQPIFDRSKKVFGYELLHRSSATQNKFAQTDGDAASQQVIHNSLNVMPLAEVTGERKAFINLTRKLLVEQFYTLLPCECAVIELLENVPVDDEVIAACKALKEAGYLLALDDFVDEEQYRPLLEFTDILKIDFMLSDAAKRKYFAERYGGANIMLLAEKVETHDDFQQAFDLGYTYFQGYFFCKPQIMTGREMPAYKQSYIRFIHEINRTPMDFGKIEEVIKSEASLAAKLLRYLNSSSVGLRHKLTSIKHALALLGEQPLRKWASLVAMSALCDDKPAELLVTCLVRARFCEMLSSKVGLNGRELDTFLMGLFSAMDALTDQPLDMVISEIPIAADVSAALLGANTLLGKTYRLVLAFERSNNILAEMMTRDLKVSMPLVMDLYHQALQWTDSGMKQNLAA